MNDRIRRLGIFLSACYLALFAMLNYVQVFQADELSEHPENVDVFLRDYARNRGTITTADGTVIARSVEVDDEYEFQREYPTGDLFAAVTGYYSFEFGATGLERTYNEELVGDTAEQQLRGFADLFVGEDQVGNLTTTLATTSRPRPGSSWASGGAPSSPSTPAPAGSSPSGTTRPTTPTRWPPTTSRPSATPGRSCSPTTPTRPSSPPRTRTASSPARRSRSSSAPAG